MSNAQRTANPSALVDETVQRLEEALLSGQLVPGQRLSEQELSAAFGVSRGPFREAVRTLEGRRLVTRTPHHGAHFVELSAEDFEQILWAREGLEAMACRQAAEMMTLPEVRALRRTTVESLEKVMIEGVGGVYRSGTNDNDFHLQIIRGSRNRWLEGFLSDIYALLRLFKFSPTSFGHRANASVDEHMLIIDALEKRDANEAERLMRRHISNARENLMSILRAVTPPQG
ncbi:GntR family transcriptional regulator [Paraburkholderia fynbosensis]|uniref:HTH-type transcriptional repressor RspR n=1 Tax=Paraburkholderia fynbosensis TaxID=1200993 RepID=A0A6J5H370_9BURK|nr:GntR family transcriptional regulator [Paraburkholderia fynbosensis]CAB3809735.1 HTH-type transcriptional repressor RspR [Paraburkholderia fynbosensis]